MPEKPPSESVTQRRKRPKKGDHFGAFEHRNGQRCPFTQLLSRSRLVSFPPFGPFDSTHSKLKEQTAESETEKLLSCAVRRFGGAVLFQLIEQGLQADSQNLSRPRLVVLSVL